MFTIEKVEDFSLFMASNKAREHVEPMIAHAKKSNQQFVIDNPPAIPKMPISGTFIYAHPPNYRGRPMHHYSVREWMKLMRDLKRAGMDTVILQASIWNELKECYYPSKHFKNYKQWNMLEPMLEAADASCMSVYLGGYGSVTGWKEHLTQADIDQEKENQLSCFRELLQYRDLFDGIYFVPETAFIGKRDLEKEKFLNEVYREFCGTVKREAPDKNILMSPATKYFPGKMPEMIDSWLAILDDVPLDIMAPQDSIGTCGNELVHQTKTYKAWSEICSQNDITFWSNIEIFERKAAVRGTNHSIPASPKRVAAQINNAAPYAEKLICWEAPYYMLDTTPESNSLRKFIEAQAPKLMYCH
jgi:Domain of unknown function (DUF4434)